MSGVTTDIARPSYLELLDAGELDRRVVAARDLLRRCVLCGRQCKVDRVARPEGAGCRTGVRARVDGTGFDRDVEPCLRGELGSASVRFSWCNLRCRHCPTWQVHHNGQGREVDGETLAGMMLDLQERGAAHLRLHRASHVIPHFLEALAIAGRRGLRLPIVFDTGGYDSPVGLGLLDGVVDVYVAEMKFGDSASARAIARVKNYASTNRRAIAEMHRQVGDLQFDGSGAAVRGLLVRHLVLPNAMANTGQVLKFLAERVSGGTFIHLMAGYEPVFRAGEIAQLGRATTAQELERAVALADRYGLQRRV